MIVHRLFARALGCGSMSLDETMAITSVYLYI